MIHVPPVTVVCASYISVKAADVVNMGKTALNTIQSVRTTAVEAAMRAAAEEPCVHRILGFKVMQHNKYPTAEIAMEHCPEVKEAKGLGWGGEIIVKTLMAQATWLIEESGYPENAQVMQVSAQDFRALNPT